VDAPLREVCEVILRAAPEIRFDQLIYEGTWIHTGWRQQGARQQVLTATFEKTLWGKKTHYHNGLRAA
jgi:hypothetical protein